MKKKFTAMMLLILISITITSLTGCSDDGDSEIESSNNAEVSKEEKAEVVKEEKEEKIGTRSNPINLGETIQWKVKFYDDIDSWDELEGLANVTLNKVYEGEEAIEMLYFGSEELEDVEEGYTFAVADITIELLQGDDNAPYTTSFELASVSEDGRKSPFAYTGLAEEYEENEYTELYPGGTVDIKQAFLVPKDGEYLIEIEENISGSKFFKNN